MQRAGIACHGKSPTAATRLPARFGGFGDPWPDTRNPGIPDIDPLTWAQIVAQYPEARINCNDPVFAIEIPGDPSDPFTEAINAVTFGTTAGPTRYVSGPA